MFNLFNGRRQSFEKSCELSAIANLAILEGNPDKALDLYQQAILMCPENPGPYWPVIASLHGKGLDAEAFDLFKKVKDLDCQIIAEFKDNQWLRMSGAIPSIIEQIPAVVGMLVVLDKTEMAKEVLIQQLKNLQRREKNLKSFDIGIFKGMIAWEMCNLTLSENKKFLLLLTDVALEGYIVIEEWQPLIDDCVEKIVIKAILLVREGRLPDALECIDFVLNVEMKNFKFINRSLLVTLKNKLEEEIKEEKKWSLERSDDDFLLYLFRRLSFKFHPDFSMGDEKDEVMRTKIMKEINLAKDEKDMGKLEDIVNKYIPEWSKYLRKTK